MVDDLRRPETKARGPSPGLGRPQPQRGTSEQIQNLRSLREWVLERLDLLNAGSATVGGLPCAETITGRERTIALKLVELKETECRHHAQAERQEKEWNAALTQLEADRRLLAEAWERVERERIEYLSVSKLDHHAHAQARSPQEGCPHRAFSRRPPLVPAQSDRGRCGTGWPGFTGDPPDNSKPSAATFEQLPNRTATRVENGRRPES